MEKVKRLDHQSTKMTCGVSIAKNQGMLRRLVGNFMKSCNHLVEGMEFDMHNMDSGVVKPIFVNEVASIE